MNGLKCLECGEGVLLPLSDFGGQGAPIHYKAWVCSSPNCDYNLKIRNGDVFRNEPVMNGANHPASLPLGLTGAPNVVYILHRRRMRVSLIT